MLLAACKVLVDNVHKDRLRARLNVSLHTLLYSTVIQAGTILVLVTYVRCAAAHSLSIVTCCRVEYKLVRWSFVLLQEPTQGRVCTYVEEQSVLIPAVNLASLDRSTIPSSLLPAVSSSGPVGAT